MSIADAKEILNAYRPTSGVYALVDPRSGRVMYAENRRLILNLCGDVDMMVRAGRESETSRPALATTHLVGARHVMTARHDNTSKQCSKCGAFKEFSLFHLDGRGMGIGGRKAVCKACDREILAARRARKRKPPVVPTCFYPETKVLDADGRDWAWAFVWYKPAARASRYTVGSDGKVWSQGPHGQWIELRPCSGDDGRMKVGLFIGGQSVRIKVHKIVMETFWGPCPEGLELCHNNGNPSDNRLSNLRYDTHSSNMMDRVEHGTANRGERHGMAKLSKPQAIEILRRLADGERPSAIALDFGVSAAAVKAIDYGITWAYLPRPEPVSRVFYGPTDPRE